MKKLFLKTLFVGFVSFFLLSFYGCGDNNSSNQTITLDDEDEEAEDLLAIAKKQANNERFSSAYTTLKEARKVGGKTPDFKEVYAYVEKQEKAYEAKLERERQRQAKLEQERREQQYNSSGFRGISKYKCYRISQYAPQKVCLEGTGGNACYALKDYALQKVCLEGAGTDACYAFSDYAKQQICLKGIRSDACYSISNNYQQQNSCMKFSGSTEFWLIFSSYGYYTF
jgi:hypothetical protein